jgi:glycosyltransferase involved in cell wall biosynthesis
MQSVVKFSIIFPTHNRSNYILHALESFATLEGLLNVSFELLIVANACTDDTVKLTRDKLVDVHYPWKIIEEEKPGLSNARNAGIKASTGEIIVFLDDDIEFDLNWLIGLDKSFNESNYDIIGGKISLWWKDCVEPNWFTLYERRLLGFNDAGDGLFDGTPGMIFGGNFAFKRSIMTCVDGFDSSFGRVGEKKGAGEEADFVTRSILSGFKLGFSSHFEVKHLVTPDRITLNSLTKFSIGAGRAHGALGSRNNRAKVKKYIKLVFRFVKNVFHSPRHAILVLFNNLAEVKLLG